MSEITNEIKKRRTFAIISHPDAGKTTLDREISFIWRGDQLRPALSREKQLQDMRCRTGWR